MAIDFYGVFTLLMVLTAASSYINFRYLKLPPTIGIMIIALICSVGLVFAGKISISFKSIPQSIITSVDFESLLMRVMLSFLLFAGGVHIDIQKLKKQMAAICAYWFESCYYIYFPCIAQGGGLKRTFFRLCRGRDGFCWPGSFRGWAWLR